jgi:septal ring factor EnvC (AmiA/AmiB activator)
VLRRLKKMEAELRELKTEVAELTAAIRRLETICGRMDGHITNVEHLIAAAKTPANFIKQQIERLMGVTAATPSLDFVPAPVLAPA